MPDNLDKNLLDRTVASFGVFSDFLGLLGGPLATALEEILPKLREDRIVIFIRSLAEKLELIDCKIDEIAARDPQNIRLIETGMLFAARAAKERRIENIAQIVCNGLSSDNASSIRHERLLDTLEEIDDDQVTLLVAYRDYGIDRRSDAWSQINRPTSYSRRDNFMTPLGDEFELYKLGRDQLSRMNLLREIPSRDATMRFVRRNPLMSEEDALEITYLGRLLLREIDL